MMQIKSQIIPKMKILKPAKLRESRFLKISDEVMLNQ